MNTPKANFFLLALLFFHVILILSRGYFLSIEFTLYPYLTAHGFLPYKEIIDQHLPALFFGPFSLPSFLTLHHSSLLTLFLVTLLITDLLLYLVFIKHKLHQPLVWLGFYIASSIYFSGNVLWVETFVNLLLAAYLFLSTSKRPLTLFATGFLFFLIVTLRPTILPAMMFLGFETLKPLSKFHLLGFLVGVLIQIAYLLRFDLFRDFYHLAVYFNSHVYTKAALLFPAKRQVLLVLVWLAPTIYYLVKRKRPLSLLTVTLLILLAYPRFGFEHLQPLILLSVFFLANTIRKPGTFIYIYTTFLIFLSLISAYRHHYGNYFLTPEVKNISRIVKSLPGKHVYLLGTSDLVYPLSSKLPPNFTYVPSLPWYLREPSFQGKIIDSLKNSYTPVVVDFDAYVDGYNIVSESHIIFSYIKHSFTPGERIGRYQIFYPTP